MQLTQNLPIAGVVTHERDARDFILTNHVDLPALLPFAQQAGITDLGTRDIYAIAKKEDVPFLLPQIQGGTITRIEGDKYQFSVDTASEDTTLLVSVDVEPGTKIGENGEPFKITVSNKKLGSYGSRIMLDPMLPYVMEVEEFADKGEQIQYTVRFRGNHKGETFIPSNLFQVKAPLYKSAATRSAEFGQNYDGWSVGGGVSRKFISQVTNAEVQTHYRMTRQACQFVDGRTMDATWVKNNLYKVVDFMAIKAQYEGQVLNPQIKTYTDFLRQSDTPKDGSVIGFEAFAMIYDQISMGILNKMTVNTQVWDPGGVTGSDGLDKQYIHPGVWHQMDYSGMKHTFDINTFSEDLILAAIRAFETRTGIEVPTYGNERLYRVKTGRAGVMLLNKIFSKYAEAAITGLVLADAIGQVKGTYQSGLDIYTAPWFKSVTIPGQYKLMWELDPSLDPTKPTGHNPMVNGFRLSSYAMIIEDASYASSNIKILRSEDYGSDGNMRMHVVNGTFAHPLFQMTRNGIPAHAASHNMTGFAAYFTAKPDTAIVWNPYRMLKLSPINPFTNLAVF